MAGNEMDYPLAEDQENRPRPRVTLNFLFLVAIAGMFFAVAIMYSVVGYIIPPKISTEISAGKPPPALSPLWMIGVRGGGHPEFFASLCNALAWLERTDTNSLDKRATAVASVQRLYAVLAFPVESRMDLCVSSHSGLFPNTVAWSFYDGHQLMTVILAVMEKSGLEPKDISADLTAAGMRLAFLASLKSQLQSWRSNSDGKPESYLNEIIRWQNFWNFTDADLDLNETEIAAVREQKEADARAVGLPPADRL